MKPDYAVYPNLTYVSIAKHQAMWMGPNVYVCKCGYNPQLPRRGMVGLREIAEHIRAQNELIVHASWKVAE